MLILQMASLGMKLYGPWRLVAMQAARAFLICGLTPRLTGAGARSAQGTNTGHQNAEGMASVGVRVEPTVRLRRVGRVRQVHSSYVRFNCPQNDRRRRIEEFITVEGRLPGLT
jgi:hypothetical protein